MQNYQWGIIGTGDIAHQFAKNFKSTESSITGVAARDFEKKQKPLQKSIQSLVLTKQLKKC